MRHSRIGKLLGVAVGVAALVGLSALVTGGFARSKDDASALVAQAKQRGFVFACTQRKGHNQSKGDLNIRLKAFCAKGQKPLKLATWPLKGKRGPQGPPGPPGPSGGSGGGAGSSAEYGVANVFVHTTALTLGRLALRPTRSISARRSARPRAGSSASRARPLSRRARSRSGPPFSRATLAKRSSTRGSDDPQAGRRLRLTVPMIYCEYADGGAEPDRARAVGNRGRRDSRASHIGRRGLVRLRQHRSAGKPGEWKRSG